MSEMSTRPSERTARHRWRWAAYVAVVVAIAAVVGRNARDERHRARAAQCAANLKRIGEAILLYANDHRNQYPDTFATLLATPPSAETLALFRDYRPIDLAAFACPASGRASPASADELAIDRCDYVFLRDTMPFYRPDPTGGFGRPSSISAEEAVAIERPVHHAGGVHVLYGDGHVEFIAVSDATSEDWDDVQSDLMRPGARRVRWPASQPWTR